MSEVEINHTTEVTPVAPVTPEVSEQVTPEVSPSTETPEAPSTETTEEIPAVPDLFSLGCLKDFNNLKEFLGYDSKDIFTFNMMLFYIFITSMFSLITLGELFIRVIKCVEFVLFLFFTSLFAAIFLLSVALSNLFCSVKDDIGNIAKVLFHHIHK